MEVVKFAPDYPWVAAGTASGTLSIYDFESGSQRYVCYHDGMAVVRCLWMKMGDELCITSACIDGAIRIWDARSGDTVKVCNQATI